MQVLWNQSQRRFRFRPYFGIVVVNGTLEITVYIVVIINFWAVTALKYLEI